MRPLFQRLVFRLHHRMTWAAVCTALAPARCSMPGRVPVRVTRRREAATDILLLELAPLPGQALSPAVAGAFIDVHLAGHDARFALCTHAGDPRRYLIAVHCDARSGTVARMLHQIVREGDILQIGAPVLELALVPGARRSLLIAGDLGIAPLFGMAEQLARCGSAFTLHYRGRSALRMAFLKQLSASGFAAQVDVHLSDGPGQQLLDIDAVLGEREQGSHVYVCGPDSFVDTVTAAAYMLGWPYDAVHWSCLGAPPVVGVDAETAPAPAGARFCAQQMDAFAALVPDGVIVPVDTRRPGA